MPVNVVPPDEYEPTAKESPQLPNVPVAVSVQVNVPELEYPEGIFIVAVYVAEPLV